MDTLLQQSSPVDGGIPYNEYLNNTVCFSQVITILLMKNGFMICQKLPNLMKALQRNIERDIDCYNCGPDTQASYYSIKSLMFELYLYNRDAKVWDQNGAEIEFASYQDGMHPKNLFPNLYMDSRYYVKKGYKFEIVNQKLVSMKTPRLLTITGIPIPSSSFNGGTPSIPVLEK